ncbi:MAG: TonB-dependent receptor [Saprospiraceae bacterium]
MGKWGNVPLPHRAQTIYEVGSFSTFSDNITLRTSVAASLTNGWVTPTLKPEVKTEYEAGIDLRFYRNRIALSATYYTNEVKDALLDMSLVPSLDIPRFTETVPILKTKALKWICALIS